VQKRTITYNVILNTISKVISNLVSQDVNAVYLFLYMRKITHGKGVGLLYIFSRFPSTGQDRSQGWTNTCLRVIDLCTRSCQQSFDFACKSHPYMVIHIWFHIFSHVLSISSLQIEAFYSLCVVRNMILMQNKIPKYVIMFKA